MDAYHVANHCFLPKDLLEKKGFPLDVPLFFEGKSMHTVCWYGKTGQGLEYDREAMIRNIKLSNGICVFLGKSSKGMKNELKLAQKWGCEIKQY